MSPSSNTDTSQSALPLWYQLDSYSRVTESNPDEVMFSFHAAAILLFYITQRITFQSFLFSKNLQPYVAVWPYGRRRYCRSTHITSSFVRNVGTTDRKKL